MSQAAIPITGKATRRILRTNIERGAGKGDVLFGKEEKQIPDLQDSEEIIREVKSYQSNQLLDPFSNDYNLSIGGSTFSIIKPPFNPNTIRRLPNENNMLRQCIDAMVTNVESYGYRLEYVGEEGSEDSKEALAEFQRLTSILNQPNDEYDLIELRERVRKDLETFGYAFIELTRDGLGDVVMFYHVPAYSLRLTVKELEPTDVTVYLKRNGKNVATKVKKHFRRYVQEVNNKKIYFKEFGDPRSISPKDGKERPLGTTEQATELLMFSIYDPSTAYGMPRWINQLPSITGSRESELTNLNFFKNNAIPAMAVLVSGAALTTDSFNAIEEHLNGTKGRDSMNRVIVLEALSADSDTQMDEHLPTPKLDIKSLVNERQSDGLFQQYDEACQNKIRSSFRLPPLYMGHSQDHTRSTAEASMVVAEVQVFLPARNKMDEVFNGKILLSQNDTPKYWRFRSNAPRIVNPETILTALKQLDSVGALTPNVAIGMANELFDLNITSIPQEWGNYPFGVVMELVKQGTLAGIEELLIPVVPQDNTKDKLPEGGFPDPEVTDVTTDPEELKQAEVRKLTIGKLQEIVEVSKNASISDGKSRSAKRIQSRIVKQVPKI